MEKYPWGYKISSINSLPVTLVVQLLFTQVLRIFRVGECSKQVVHVADVCEARVKLNWVSYLTNEVLQNCIEMQDEI